MPKKISEFIEEYCKQENESNKITLFHYKRGTLHLGKCVISTIQDNLIYINETVDMYEVNKLRDSLITTSKEFNLIPILIPFKYGEEDMPNNTEIKYRLESRLKYWLNNQQELSNNKIRGQYMAYYEQFEKFLSKTSSETINSQLSTLYEQICDKKFIKALKLQVARRKANIK